jgi:hypothetical protein
VRGNRGNTSSSSCRVIKPLRRRFFRNASLSILGMAQFRQVLFPSLLDEWEDKNVRGMGGSVTKTLLFTISI